MRTQKASIIIVFIFLLVNSLYADIVPTHSIGNKDSGFKNFTLGVIVDSSRTLQIEDIVNLQENVKITDSRFTISSIEPDYWFILKLHNPLNTPLKQNIGFNEACFEVANIYYQKDNAWHSEKNGLIIPLKQRSIQNRWPIFEVLFEPLETKTIYLKLHSKYLVPLSVISENVPVMRNEEKKQFIGYWFYFGAAISFLLYNLFLYFQVKDRTYLFYVFYLFFLILWISLWSGFFIYLSSSLKLYYFLSVGVPIMSIFIILFTRELLKIKQNSKWIDSVLIGLCLVSGIFALLVIYDIYYYQYLGLLGMVIMLFLFFTGVYAFWKKVPLSRTYLLAMSFYLIGLFIVAGLTIGVIPYNSLSRYGFMVGSFMEITLFSFALGYRIKLLQIKKDRYQNKIIETERSMKKKLEIQILERTEELTKTSQMLELVNKELSAQIQEKDKAIEALELSDRELQISNRSKDKLFSIIGHDLRSPFNSILGFSELLTENIKDLSIEESEEYSNYINLSAKNTLVLLDNLLSWAKSQTGQLSFKAEKMVLLDLILEIIELNNLAAQSKNITLNYSSIDGIEVYADKNMLRTVLRNLISNAIKFTNLDGQINISAISEQNQVEIAISDNGVGMNKETINKLFRLDLNYTNRGTANENGSGLGLILCKEFIESHDGRIRVESEIGKGSTFKFTLPD